MADKKLLKEFPFLQDAEKRYGDLGVIRVRSISQSDMRKVNDLQNEITAKIIVNQIDKIDLPISEQKDTDLEGFLVHHIKTSLGNLDETISPYFSQTVVYKIKKENEKIMSNNKQYADIIYPFPFGDLNLGTLVYVENEYTMPGGNPISFIPDVSNQTLYYLDANNNRKTFEPMIYLNTFKQLDSEDPVVVISVEDSSPNNFPNMNFELGFKSYPPVANLMNDDEIRRFLDPGAYEEDDVETIDVPYYGSLGIGDPIGQLTLDENNNPVEFALNDDPMMAEYKGKSFKCKLREDFVGIINNGTELNGNIIVDFNKDELPNVESINLRINWKSTVKAFKINEQKEYDMKTDHMYIQTIIKFNNKKTVKPIKLYLIKDILDKVVDIGISLNKVELADMDRSKALQMLNNYGMIKDGYVVIPSGLELTNIADSGSPDYNFCDGLIVVYDMFFEDDDEENEYIQ